MSDYYHIGIGELAPVKNPIVITFDDGYLDNWQWAYPILKKYGLKATIFISPEYVDTRGGIRPNLEDVWNNRARMDDLKQWGFLSWEEMRIMEASGVISIESHTMTHTKYPVAATIKCFNHPNADSLYTIGNLYPNKKPWYISDPSFDTLVPFGYPIFEDASSVIARKVTINPKFINECVETLKDWQMEYYNHDETFKMIETLYRKYKEQYNLVINTETEDEYLGRLNYEINGSKKVIEGKLEKTVKFLCWPHGDNNETAHRMAMEAGYLATTTGSKQKVVYSTTRIPIRIGMYHSKNSRILSMLKMRYKIGSYQKLSPWVQIEMVYHAIAHHKKLNKHND